MTQKPSIKQAIEAITKAICDAIAECGQEGMTSGNLYVCLQDTLGLSLDNYNSLIAVLVKNGKIRQNHHKLFWIGGPR